MSEPRRGVDPRRRRRLRLALAGALAYAGVCAVTGVTLCEAAIRPPRRRVDPQAVVRVREALGGLAARLETVRVRAGDGTALEAWHLLPPEPNGNLVLLLHGVSDSRLGVVEHARVFLRRGFEALAPDARAHGESGGEIATFGVREREDVRAWVDWIVRERGPRCVFAFGASMGAAILLQSLAVEPRFCAVAAESSFSSFREAAFDYTGRPVGAGPWLGRTLLRPAVEAGILYGRLRYGVDFVAASPERAIASTSVPILLVHGTGDENLPPRHSRRLRASDPSRISIWEVPGATHAGALGRAPVEFEVLVAGWFEGR